MWLSFITCLESNPVAHKDRRLAAAFGGKEARFGTARRPVQQASAAVSFSTFWPDFNLGLTRSCLIPAWTFKKGNTGTGSNQQQSASADRWLQFKCPLPKRTGEMKWKWKICPFRKKKSFWPDSWAKDRYRNGTFGSIWSSGSLMPVLSHQSYLLETLCLLRVGAKWKNKHLFWFFCPKLLLKTSLYDRV